MTERRVRWGKLYADLPIRKAHYTDRQFRAFVTLLAYAIGQDSAVFRSRAQVVALVGKAAADHLFAEGDLVVHDWRDRIELVGFDSLQGPKDSTAADRKRRQRDRDALVTDVTVTRDNHGPSPISSVSVTSNDATNQEEGSGEEDALTPILKEVEALTGRPWAYSPGSRAFDTLRYDVRDFGADRVRTALRRVTSAGKVHDGAALVMAAHRIVQPIPDVRAAAAQAEADERAAAEERAKQRRLEATRAKISELSGVAPRQGDG